MASHKPCCEEERADVPAWFMTYSDVITLLMTFFILLLTFATNEPEHFARMQVAMFGGGSSSGLAGQNNEPFDQNAMLLRVRPRSARLTIRGSETPPLYSDPSYETLDRGVETLKESHELAEAERLSITVPLSVMIDGRGEVTPVGRQQLRTISSQMRRMPLEITLQANHPQGVAACLQLANELIGRGMVSPGRISIGAQASTVPAGAMRLTLLRTKAGV